MYPKDIDKLYEGCIYSYNDKKVTNATIHLKCKLYKMQFSNYKELKGTISINDKPYNVFLVKGKEPLFSGLLTRSGEPSLIPMLSEDFQAIEISEGSKLNILIFAPAKNKEDYSNVVKKLGLQSILEETK